MSEDDLKKIDEFIGRRIHELRVVNDKSPQQLAELISITEEQLEKYELGIGRILFTELVIISKIFDKDINYFYPD